ncbi:MAG: hypothetical protein JNK15_23720 [Planctomycetes bacterium]|nr:hypothetical protein [Planctomycetota bacterium]
MKVIFGILFLLLFASVLVKRCEGPERVVRRVPASRATFSGEWPLTVESGTVERRIRDSDGARHEIVVFVTQDGAEYALNGTARGLGFLAIEPIWRDAPPPLGPKVDLGPLLKLGL